MKKKIVMTAVLLVLAVMAAACGSNGGNGHQYTGEDDYITLKCDQDGDFTFFVADLMALEAVTEQIVRKDDEGQVTDEYPIKGVSLEVVLASIKKNIQDLDTIRLVAGDGYSVEVPNDILTRSTVILAYEIDGAPLQENTKPIRVFIPGEEAMYWVRNIVEISLTAKAASDADHMLAQMVFFETLQADLETEDYDGEQKAVPMADVFAGVQASDQVYLLAADGFEKNEEFATVMEAFLVVEGDNAPAFRSPDLPRGMHVRDLVWMSSGDTGFLFVERGLEFFAQAEVDGNTGISLSGLVEQFGLSADVYVLEAADGYSVEITKEDLALGIVYIRDSGEISSVFDGLPRNTAVKGLLSIKAAD